MVFPFNVPICLLQIAGLRFIFLVNQELISAIRQEAVKVNIPV